MGKFYESKRRKAEGLKRVVVMAAWLRKDVLALKNILLVDDSKFMRNYLKSVLMRADFNIVEADNGMHAIDQYKKYSPEIVLMDITMPILNGLDTLREILKIDPHAKIIMCSSLGQQPIIKEALLLGAKDFVVKPYFNNLVPMINSYCQ